MLRVISLSAVLVSVVVVASIAQDDTPLAASDEVGNTGFLGPDPHRDREATSEQISPDAVGAPHDIAPQHAVASVADGQLYLVRFSFQLQQRHTVAKIEANGLSSAEAILQHVPIGHAHSSWHDLDTVFAYIDGNEVPREELAHRLAKATHVLIAPRKVDSFYLGLVSRICG